MDRRRYAVFFGNIPHFVGEEEFRKRIEKFGSVESFYFCQGKLGKSLGRKCSLVYFEDAKSVDSVLLANPNTLPLFSDPETMEKTRISAHYIDPRRTIVIRNLPNGMTSSHLSEILYNSCQVEEEEIDLSQDYENSGTMKAIVGYRNASEASRVLSTLRNSAEIIEYGFVVELEKIHYLHPRRLKKIKSLFLCGIPTTMFERDVVSFLSRLKIFPVKVLVPLDKRTKKHLGHSIIRMKTKEEAQRVMAILKKKNMYGQRLGVKWALPPNLRQLSSQGKIVIPIVEKVERQIAAKDVRVGRSSMGRRNRGVPFRREPLMMESVLSSIATPDISEKTDFLEKDPVKRLNNKLVEIFGSDNSVCRNPLEDLDIFKVCRDASKTERFRIFTETASPMSKKRSTNLEDNGSLFLKMDFLELPRSPKRRH